MAERVAHERVDVARHDVVAAADQRERARGGDEADRAARAGAERDVVGDLREPVLARAARRGGDVDGPADQRRDRRRPPSPAAAVPSAPRATAPGRAPGAASSERATTVSSSSWRRVVDEDLQHEAVDLRLRQRIGALRLDRVLRREHEERPRHRERVVPDRHLALLHHLEQRRLHLRRGAVDLVGEEEVAEDRPELRLELAAVGPVDARADEVGRARGPA